MFRIRRGQMVVLRDRALACVVERMAAHLRVRFPEGLAQTDEAQLRERVRQGIREAESHGVTEEYDVRRYLEYRVELGGAFGTDRGPGWANAILRDDTLSGTEKLDRIDEGATFAAGGT